MKIETEYNELIKQFWSAGPLGKLMLVLTLFLSISSLAAMSDAVFKWKGFILNALEIYKDYFVSTLVKFAPYIKMNFSEEEIHTAVLMSISVNVGMRILMAGQIVAFKKINEHYNSDMVPNQKIYKAILWLLPLSIWIWYGISVQTPNPWVTGFVFVFYPLFLVLPKTLMNKFSSEKNSYWEKGEFNYFKAYYSYVGALFLIVCILGAINTGLSKPA
jgi:hypothetical protein